MKKILLLALALGPAISYAGKPSEIPSQRFLGECIHSFSSNGEWMVSELDYERSMVIRNLVTGREWTYYADGYEGGIDYTLCMTNDVSNDGTVIAEVAGIPSYWRNGKWTSLPGAAGHVAAMLGGITPDSRVIVGSMSGPSSRQTKPCVWYLQDDGTYAAPVYLPDPARNSFSGGAQYINATAISDDGKTVAVSLRSGSGFNNVPYVYTQAEDGKWTSKALGTSLFSSAAGDLPPNPGAYRGPSAPNYEAYMTQEQIDAFYAASNAWVDEQYAKGLSDDEVYVEGYRYAMEFMTEENREKYRPLVEAFATSYLKWAADMARYQEALDKVADQIVDFEFNNVFVSPDGKYVFASSYKSVVQDPTNPEFGIVNIHAPVKFDVATGNATVYPTDFDAIITGVTADYSVLAWDYDMDVHLYRPAYIFPGESTQAVEIQEYWKQQGNEYAYLWTERNFYQEVFLGMANNGNYMWGDAWSIGKPVATPDMSLWGYGGSTLYWSAPPSESYLLITGILNPNGENLNQTPEQPEDPSDTDQSGVYEVVDYDNFTSYIIYNMSGIPVGRGFNFNESTTTSLAPGLYIIVRETESGKTSTSKIRID